VLACSFQKDHKVFLRLAIALFIACAYSRSVRADPANDQNWPAWRGPLATGASPTADPPTTWSDTQNIKWKAEIPGEGTSTPIVWGDRVFVLAAIDTDKRGQAATPAELPPPPDRGGGRRGRGGMGRGTPPSNVYQFVILCLDRKTGKLLWQQVAREEVPHEGRHPSEGSFASPSPVTDGKNVYAFFGSRGLYCYDMDGKLQWSKDLGKMRIFLTFGEGSSPALCGDSLIINWDNEDGSFITALDKSTGKTLWKTTRNEHTAWATPLIVDVGGKAQIVTIATSKTRTYDATSGKLLWEGPGLTRNVIPSPVAADGIAYVMSGYQGHSAMAIRLDKTADSNSSDPIVWKFGKKTPYVPSPLLYNGRLWFFADNAEIVTCLEAKSGKPIIDGQRIDGLLGVFASPVAAAGKVYLIGRNGGVVVMKDGNEPKVIATNHLDDKFDASPALAGADLFLRGQHTLYCISESAIQ